MQICNWIKNKKGSVMVETVIVFPMVMMTVFAMLFLGLFKLQEMSMLYAVQRATHQSAAIVANPGYEHLGNYNTKSVDFTSASPEDVNAYYKAFRQNVPTLYREIAGSSGWNGKSKAQDLFDDIIDTTLVLHGGTLTDNTITVSRSLLGTSVVAESTFSFRTPGAMRYFGYPDHLEYKQSAYGSGYYPAGFIRNVDLAGDALTIAAKKLGIDKNVGKIIEGINKYIF